MRDISEAIIRHRYLVVAVFVVAALLGGVLQFGVRTNYNIIDYLPQDAQSTKALTIMKSEFTTDIPNARVMLNDVTIQEALEYKQQLATMDGVSNVMWLDDVVDLRVPLQMADQGIVENYYKHGKALISLTIREGDEVAVTKAIYALIGGNNALAGQAADRATLQSMTGSETRSATLILVPLIILILVLSTSSWMEPLLFLGAIGVSVLINMGTNLIFGEVSFITKSVSPILQLAVSLDYAIFLLHSFEDFRKLTSDVKEAMRLAMARAFSTIAASAATTLFGFMALIFMRFQIGADLGINLAKGIVFSFISVMVFLPALTLSSYKLIDRTRHKNLMPSFAGVGRFVYKVRVPVLLLVTAMLIPSYLAQSRSNFIYGDSDLGAASRSGMDTRAINEAFGQSTPIIILVPRGEAAKEHLLSEDLKNLSAVDEVIAYATLVGSTIPPELLSPAITNQFYSGNYARIIAYTDTPAEGDRAFSVVEDVQGVVRGYYGNDAYFSGQSVTLYDMKNVVTADNKTVNLIAIAAIFAVLLITFGSLFLPLGLLLTIETAIWINLAVPYFIDSSLSYVGYLIVSAVQLGATVDYAILLTSHYLVNRKTLPRKEALYKTVQETFGSILVSAAILAIAGATLWSTSSNPIVAELGMLLGRGTLLSMLMVVCFLPAVLTLFDGIIAKTTRKSDFFGER